jgi:hypothetical protein
MGSGRGSTRTAPTPPTRSTAALSTAPSRPPEPRPSIRRRHGDTRGAPTVTLASCIPGRAAATRAADPVASPSTSFVSSSFFLHFRRSSRQLRKQITIFTRSLKKIPIFVRVIAVREGSDGDGKKVDPRCPNAPNPFHVCTDHCLAKMAEAGRSSEGGKSPLSIFSRHSRRSSSSSEGCCFITYNVSLSPTR